ncbi:MAG: tripeptidase T [Anaerolineae bacterium]
MTTPDDFLAQTLIDLCRIPSPSGQEGAVAAYIRAVAADLGLTVAEDDAGPALGSDTGNLLIRAPGVGEPLFLAAHMDTVPPTVVDGQVPVVVEGDRVHTGGRSILGADDKAGVAVGLGMLRRAVRQPERTRPLEVIFTVQEEQGARGARHFDPARITARYGYNLDGDTPVAVAIREAPHKSRFYIDVQGKAAHAALNPADGINAVQGIAAIAAALPTGQIDADTVANVGRIEGGGATNIVPDRARLIGEVRSLRRERLDALQAEIEATAHRQGAARGVAVTVTWEPLYGGYFVADDTACVEAFLRACRAEGLAGSLVRTYGGGDANAFNSKGMPCIVFGLGMQRIHTPEESILLSDLARAARILARIVGV